MKNPTTSQRGAMLAEAALSAGLIMMAAISMLSFTTHSLKTLQRVSDALRPGCERPECVTSKTLSTCSCAKRHIAVVIH